MSQDSQSLEWKAQCFLLSNIKDVIDQSGRQFDQDALADGKVPSGPPPVAVQKVRGNPNAVINSLMKKKTLDILKLPDIYQNLALQPYIQIFKTIVDDDDNEIDYPILASDYYNHTLNADPKNILSPSLRDGGVKIKDLEFVRLGGNPAEIETNIEVTLTLQADKLGSYVAKQFPLSASPSGERDSEGISWIDLLTLNRLGSNPDLQIYDDKRAQIKLEIGYVDPAKIPGLRNEIKNSEFDKWAEVIAEQRELFNLKFVEHEFNFQGDGSVTLKLVFIAAAHVAQQVQEADLLQSPALVARIKAFSDKARDIKAAGAELEPVDVPEAADLSIALPGVATTAESQDVLEERAKLAAHAAAIEQNTAIDRCRELIGQEVQEIETAIRTARMSGAKRLFDQLWLGFGRGEEHTNYVPRIYGIKVNKADLETTAGIEANSVRNIADFRSRSVAVAALYGRETNYAAMRDVAEGGGVINEDAFQGLQEEGRVSIAISGDEGPMVTQAMLEVLNAQGVWDEDRFPGADEFDTAELAEDETVVLFCYLGDIIEAACEIVAQNNGYTGATPASPTTAGEGYPEYTAASQAPYAIPFFANVTSTGLGQGAQRFIKRYGNFLCSDVIYRDPRKSGDPINVNIADIPINFEIFRSWWYNKVIAPMRTTFFLRHFIESIVNDLIAPALGSNCSDYDEEPIPKITLNSFSMPGSWNTLIDSTAWHAGTIAGDRAAREAENEQRRIDEQRIAADLVRAEEEQQAFDEETAASEEPTALDVAARFALGAVTLGVSEIDTVVTAAAETAVGEYVVEAAEEAARTMGVTARVTLAPSAALFRETFGAAEAIADADPSTDFAQRTALTVADLRNLTNGLSVDSANPKTWEVTIIHQLEAAADPGKRHGDMERDEEDNIYHLIFGEATTSLIKSLSFAREDLPGLREARLMQDQGNNTLFILRDVYNAVIKMHGNIAYKPGSVLYVDPGPLDLGYATSEESHARALGLGGYYYVIRVSNILKLADTISWETSLETKWNNFDETDARIASGGAVAPICLSPSAMLAELEAKLHAANAEGNSAQADIARDEIERHESTYTGDLAVGLSFAGSDVGEFREVMYNENGDVIAGTTAVQEVEAALQDSE